MEQVEFERAMAELRKDYMQTLPERLEEVERAWDQASGSDWDEVQYKTFIRLTHNLAGSGATYGVKQISEAARRLEMYAKSVDANAALSEDERAEIRALLEPLKESIQ